MVTECHNVASITLLKGVSKGPLGASRASMDIGSVGGVIHSPYILEPLKELCLGTHITIKLALKLMIILSSTPNNLLAPDALLRRLLSVLITKIRQRVLLITLLVPTDFSFPLGGGNARCLRPRYLVCIHTIRLDTCVGLSILKPRGRTWQA
eukprot:scaffold188931_cov14-Tisochrysis_lutea.AAC.1